MGIYLDLLIILNFLVDFCLLMGTNRLAGYPNCIKKCLLGAILGGFYAGACMVPGFYFLGNEIWRLVSLALMGGIAFGWNRSGLQRGAIFWLLSLALGGIASCMYMKHFFGIVTAGGLIWLLCHMGFRGGQKEYVPIELTWGDKRMSLVALRDTGNNLRDPITGEAVTVLSPEVGHKLGVPAAARMGMMR